MEHHDEEESGEKGLGTESGANEPGSQNPDHSPGATPEGEATGEGQSSKSDEAPDNPVGTEMPGTDDSTTQHDTPQEGKMEEDPDTSHDSN